MAKYDERDGLPPHHWIHNHFPDRVSEAVEQCRTALLLQEFLVYVPETADRFDRSKNMRVRLDIDNKTLIFDCISLAEFRAVFRATYKHLLKAIADQPDLLSVADKVDYRQCQGATRTIFGLQPEVSIKNDDRP